MHLYSSYSASCSSGVKSPTQPETEIDSNDRLSIATRDLLMKGSFILGLVGRNHGLRGFGSTGRRGKITWSGSAVTTRTKLLKPLRQLILLLRRQVARASRNGSRHDCDAQYRHENPRHLNAFHRYAGPIIRVLTRSDRNEIVLADDRRHPFAWRFAFSETEMVARYFRRQCLREVFAMGTVSLGA